VECRGLYVVLKDSQLFTFTSEYRTAPPREVTDLFYEVEKLPAEEEGPRPVRDVCLGFCYGCRSIRVSIFKPTLLRPNTRND